MTEAPYDKRCSRICRLHPAKLRYTRIEISSDVLGCNFVNDSKRTTNGTESFQADFNAQFYSDHLKIYFYLDVIKKIQTTAYTSTWGHCIPIVECRTRSIYTLSCISTNCMSEEKFQGVDLSGQLHIYMYIQIILREQICNLQPNLYSSAITTVFFICCVCFKEF